MIGFTLAVMAGLCAAVASVFAKLAMSPAMWKGWICETLLVNLTTLDGTCNMVQHFAIYLIYINSFHLHPQLHCMLYPNLYKKRLFSTLSI